MWMSSILIVVNQNNADRNGLADLAAAAIETGAQCVAMNEPCGVIEATVPAHEVPTIAAMDGVAYVRNVFTYFCNALPPKAA